MAYQRGVSETVHGTIGAYTNKKCRCDLCRLEWAAYVRTRKAKRDENGLDADDERHGKYTTYSNYRCRCEACTSAWALQSKMVARERAARKRVALVLGTDSNKSED